MIAKRSLLLLSVLILLLLPLSACGGSGGKPAVKIGAISDWSGGHSIRNNFYTERTIKLVEKQVRDMGGILDGREVKFNKYDCASNASAIPSIASKALYIDNVSVLVWGGTLTTNGEIVSDFAEQNHILYIDQSVLPADISDLKYTLRGNFRYDELEIMAEYAVKALNAKKVAILNIDFPGLREVTSRWEKILEAGGASVVYKDLIDIRTIDFSTYLKKIKNYSPDVLLTNLDYRYLLQQIKSEDFENIKVMASLAATWQVNNTDLEGWYIFARWLPGLDNPVSRKFEQDYVAMFGEEPDGMMEMMYDMLWQSIKAIEMAGTDKDLTAIATAARSGNLSLYTPLGNVIWGTDGEPVQRLGILAHVEEGKLIPVQVPE